jgi:CHAT domain-containing protein
VFLLYQPIKQGWAIEQGWVGLAITSSRIVARRLTVPDPAAAKEQLADWLLKPFRKELKDVKRLRFLPHSLLSRIDFHALPWKKGRLLERFPVVYGVDLPRARKPLPPSGNQPLAILVADPGSNLSAARREGEDVATALTEQGWRVERIEGVAATHAAVRDAIERPDAQLFHYAGHGIFKGRDGWESGMPLAEGGGLTLVDVMALKHVPARVVLSGCETAKAGDEGDAEGLGLAQAFVLAGAREVVATARRVDDRLAERIMSTLYKVPKGAFPNDLSEALQRAQRTVAAEDAAGDWEAFRVLVP